ncbi:YeeE/YedE thiosulfate transporter family protein [Fuerstiella marisgermanici]|uniref:Putative inner membrane protein n=1 Tax=Fuerstiella marisgermanici TaxID=1891926 RepID=A0A1P8WDV1_9PLAN|nr:YeeE/YedE thiosulfate transporter family protein [Fuerstiella marisgermanici]APZ92246.1 putative inner membrane protein [Fuerstiella marisgermanici]
MRQITTTTVLTLLTPAIAAAQEPTIDPLQYPGAAWSPYLVGALIGVLSMFTFYFSNKPLGASTAYARIAGLLGKVIAPTHTKSLKYFKDNPPKIGWEFMLVVGVILGGFVSAWSGGELTGRLLPEMWQARFGPDSGGLRIAVALAGGILMSFGARLSGGCTSGHGISGTLQLAVGSWVSAICFFIGGIAVAMLMFT